MQEISNNIKVFHLNALYSELKPEIKNILAKKFYLSKSYCGDINNILGNINRDFIPLERYFNCSFNSREFQNEMLGKAIYDIVVHN